MTPTSVVRALDVLLATPSPTSPPGSADAADGSESGIAIVAIVAGVLTAAVTLWVDRRVNKRERRLNSQRERLSALLTVISAIDRDLTTVNRTLRNGGPVPLPEGPALQYTEDLRATAAILADRDLARRIDLASDQVFMFTQAWQAYPPCQERLSRARASLANVRRGPEDFKTRLAQKIIDNAQPDADVTREQLQRHTAYTTPVVKERREELERLIRDL